MKFFLIYQYNNMNNSKIVELVEQITKPYFSFNDDLYGDNGTCKIRDIEDIQILFFKRNGRDRNLIITKEKENIIVEKVKKLNVGDVKISNVKCFGTSILP